MSAESNSGLKELRQTLGMSQSEFAEAVGVERNTIRRWEVGASFPQRRFLDKIIDLFENCKTDEPHEYRNRRKELYELDEKRLKAEARRRAAIQHTFAKGNCYTISDTNCPLPESSFQKFILRYEGKKGIHHFFRETRGKWIVTYTDAQLIGKHIKEVDEHGNSKA